MTVRYCGIGGNDGNSGLTWALRKLTLNGVEDTPVVAGDIIYVGPGVYREQLTVDVSGTSGNPITYIGDVTGEHTDGVGGIVRITGSDDDQLTDRDHCILGEEIEYRTFRGLSLDVTNGPLVLGIASHYWVFEDCNCQLGEVHWVVLDSIGWAIRRCLSWAPRGEHIVMAIDGEESIEGNHVIENCAFFGGHDVGISFEGDWGARIQNCLFLGCTNGIQASAFPGGESITVQNCLLVSNAVGLSANVVGEIVEDFNDFSANSSDGNNVNTGAHDSVTYPSLFQSPILHAGAGQISGFKFPWIFGALSEWSQVRAITGSNEPAMDLFGIARPATASKNSWGAVQFQDMERETGTVHAGAASLCLHDAGRHQIWVPVSNESTTISIYVYREANYAGNNPQMIVKQPGQADDVTTDAAAASQWNLLTTTLTPAADPPYVVVELVSRNTAVALAYKTFFDDLAVS